MLDPPDSSSNLLGNMAVREPIHRRARLARPNDCSGTGQLSRGKEGLGMLKFNAKFFVVKTGLVAAYCPLPIENICVLG